MNKQIDRPCLLIASSPGIGKTQLIRSVAEDLGDLRIGGFYKDEIKVGSLRRGYKLVSFDAKHEIILAHISMDSPVMSGKYGVDVPLLESFVEAIQQDLASEKYDIIIIDEVGKFEIHSEKFLAFIEAMSESPASVVITVARKSLNTLTDIRTHPRTQLLELTRSNRSTMKEKVLRVLTQAAEIAPA